MKTITEKYRRQLLTNVERMAAKRRSQTKCKYGHSLTDPNNVKIETTKEGWRKRRCLQCRKRYNREYHAFLRGKRQALFETTFGEAKL